MDEAAPNISQHQRLTLTARGVALLAKCGHLPRISKAEILDKSKADNLTKCISCLQAIWMIIQVAGRLAARLPVTLLEVNTMAHVFCALVTYVLWWHKPKLISEPTKLRGEWVAPLCAYMYMSSTISGWKSRQPGLLPHKSRYEPEMSIMAFVPDPDLDEKTDLKETTWAVKATAKEVVPTPVRTSHIDRSDPSNSISIMSENSELDTPSRAGSFKPRSEIYDTPDDKNYATVVLERLRSSNTDPASRWQLAASAVEHYPAIRDRLCSKSESSGVSYLEPMMEELVTDRASNWPTEGLLRGTGGTIMGMVLWFATMVFGAVHVAAWNDYFPTTLEAWLWRTSALFIAASGLLWLGINMLASMSKKINAFWDRFVARKAHRLSYVVILTLCAICGAAYIFARAFLVIEAFLSMRELPSQAYDTPEWSQLIPHL